jgi:hypothetical protein
MQSCVQAETAVAHARSLFGGATASVGTATELGTAVQTAQRAVTGAGELSGAGVDGYRWFANAAVPPLNVGAGSDTTLSAHVRTAATASAMGAARLDQISAQIRAITQVAPSARTPAGERIVLTALRSQLSQASRVVQSGQRHAAGIADDVRALKYPKETGGVQPAGYDVPLSPAPQDPPHGKDPRYWIDVTKVVHVPPGTLAPAGYKQIGPDLWYPSDVDRQQYNVTPPPDPVKYPLDMSTLVQTSPGQLGPYGTTQLAPGYFAPTPNPLLPAPTNWPTPQRPVDIRDVIAVPAGTLAPWGYVEYLPGWWAPDPTRGGPS